jgi:hypothetical protein
MFLKSVSCDLKMSTKLFVLFCLSLWNKTADIAYTSINDLYIFLYKSKTFINKTKKQDSMSCSSCENRKFLSNVKIFSSSRKEHNWSTNFMFLIFMLKTHLMLLRVIEFCVTSHHLINDFHKFDFHKCFINRCWIRSSISIKKSYLIFVWYCAFKIITSIMHKVEWN